MTNEELLKRLDQEIDLLHNPRGAIKPIVALLMDCRAAIRALPLPAPEVPEHRYCTLCGRETPHAPVPDPNPATSTATSIPTPEAMARPYCELCGEPMPPGEEMFKYHGSSGPCPTLPLPAPEVPWPVRAYAEWLDDCRNALDDNDVPMKNLRSWIMEEYGI